MSATHTARLGKSRWLGRYLTYLVLAVLVYLLSTGPVIGLSFWLREHWHDDRFYMALYLYWPLLAIDRGSSVGTVLDWYVTWWVSDVFHTVGPG